MTCIENFPSNRIVEINTILHLVAFAFCKILCTSISWKMPSRKHDLRIRKCLEKEYLGDHSSITSACFWLFQAHPPTYVSINSTVNQQKLPFSDPTHLFADVILEWSLVDNFPTSFFLVVEYWKALDLDKAKFLQVSIGFCFHTFLFVSTT